MKLTCMSISLRRAETEGFGLGVSLLSFRFLISQQKVEPPHRSFRHSGLCFYQESESCCSYVTCLRRPLAPTAARQRVFRLRLPKRLPFKKQHLKKTGPVLACQPKLTTCFFKPNALQRYHLAQHSSNPPDPQFDIDTDVYLESLLLPDSKRRASAQL